MDIFDINVYNIIYLFEDLSTFLSNLIYFLNEIIKLPKDIYYASISFVFP